MSTIERKDKVLTPTEIAGLKRELDQAEQDKKGNERNEQEFNPGGQRGGETDQTIRRYKQVLDRGTPEPLTQEEKIRIERQINIDRDYLKKNMVPRAQTAMRASPDPDFRKAVNFMAKFEMSQEFQTVAQRYKNDVRRLHPDSPELSNLETIRPKD